MRYIGRAVGSAWFPKLLGTYEKELWPAIAQAIRRGPDVVVNLGAAEGYYAVGMARALPHSRVIGFEAQTDYADVLRTLAERNGVQPRVEVRGLCRVADLQPALDGADCPLVLCDVEGAERILLDPAHVPALVRSCVLVEIHDMFVAGTGAEIQRRFSPTHRVECIPSAERTWRDVPPGVKITRRQLRRALGEGRPGLMHWFWMTPR
jgi:predicted O-methyltransferase YrrM